MVCITDSITVNAIWFRHCASDLFLVPNDETAAVLAKAGLNNGSVRVTGFPVTPKFCELGELRQMPAGEGERKIHYMINAGGRAAPGRSCIIRARR